MDPDSSNIDYDLNNIAIQTIKKNYSLWSKLFPTLPSSKKDGNSDSLSRNGGKPSSTNSMKSNQESNSRLGLRSK
jgi:hypothetical protein